MIPPGFRFYPTEEELVGFYLSEKLQGRRNNQLQHLIPDLDIYKHDPWDLPQLSGVQCQQDTQLQQWFFFVQRPEKEARGGRPNRLTDIGYWKAAGTSGYVYSSDKRVVIGEKRTMVFYKGRAPGSKTNWKMNEYRAIEHGDTQPLLRFEFSLCRVYIRSKCIRSFDRRPSSSSSVARAIRQRSPTPTIITSSHSDQQKLQNPPTAMMTKDSSGSTRDNLSSTHGHDQNSTRDDVRHLEDHMNQTTLHGGSWLSIVHEEVNLDDMPLWEWDDQFFDSNQLII